MQKQELTQENEMNTNIDVVDKKTENKYWCLLLIYFTEIKNSLKIKVKKKIIIFLQNK